MGGVGRRPGTAEGAPVSRKGAIHRRIFVRRGSWGAEPIAFRWLPDTWRRFQGSASDVWFPAPILHHESPPDFLCSCSSVSVCWAGQPPVRAGEATGGWKETGKQDGTLTLYEKDHAGTSIKEVRAVGTFDSPPWMVRNVLDDVEHYSQFMPYVIQSKIIAHDPAKHTITDVFADQPAGGEQPGLHHPIHDESKPGPGRGEETYVSRWEERPTTRDRRRKRGSCG